MDFFETKCYIYQTIASEQEGTTFDSGWHLFSCHESASMASHLSILALSKNNNNRTLPHGNFSNHRELLLQTLVLAFSW
jgi:hypothetical protein